MKRTPLAIWLEEYTRECLRPKSMTPKAHAEEDEYWEKIAVQVRAVVDKENKVDVNL